MKKVLVAVDGSEASLKAVQLAAELTRLADVPLAVVHVSPPSLLPPRVYADVVATIATEEKRYAEELLETAAERARAAGGRAEKVLLRGAPAEAIADLAEDPEVWMVVVGSRGRGAVSRMFLGSVADRLVHLCKKPVLVTR